MEQKDFYQHVSGWISSYRDPAALEWLRRFVHDSQQPQETKDKLQAAINAKQAELQGRPRMALSAGAYYLADEHGHPKIFTTRFAAVCEVADLKLKGYDAELVPGTVFYKIKLNAPAPLEVHQ